MPYTPPAYELVVGTCSVVRGNDRFIIRSGAKMHAAPAIPKGYWHQPHPNILPYPFPYPYPYPYP